MRYRAELINDAFGLAQAGEVDVTKALELIEYLSNEEAYFPWVTTISRLRYFSEMIDSTSVYSNFQKYLLKLITPIYNKLTWEESRTDSWLTRYMHAKMNPNQQFSFFLMLILIV